METGFALTAFVNLILNLLLPEEIEDEETPELTANEADEPGDRAEWDRIRAGANVGKEMGSEEEVGRTSSEIRRAAKA